MSIPISSNYENQSIGTVPTVDLAARYEVAAVVLHSALMSGMRVAFPQTKRTWFFDAFPRYTHTINCNIKRFLYFTQVGNAAFRAHR